MGPVYQRAAFRHVTASLLMREPINFPSERDVHAGPRLLLRQLREVMAGPKEAQDRLNNIVRLIASNVVAEVCSFYVLRADGVLELYATEGLKSEAVHSAGLRLGEGLVGLIAQEKRTLNLPDAQSHPAFAYLPETGEEAYHSFLGVPILRAGRTLGVLVVQNMAYRTYTEEEEEALQTVAMVVAEVIASGELAAIAKQSPTGLDVNRPLHLKGLSVADGIGLGHVVLHEPRLVVTNIVADNAQVELDRLDRALDRLRLSVDAMISRSDLAHHGEHRDILETYRMFAHDRGWVRKIEASIRTGLTAEAAVERVQNDMRARLGAASDIYLRERLYDLDDLGNRLIRELMGRPADPKSDAFPEDAVLIARAMGPADLLDYSGANLRGVALEDGGAMSHVAIVARALGIAAVSRLPGIVSLVEAGDAVIVDGDEGELHIRPLLDVENAYADKVRLKARRQAQYRRLRSAPAITRDGHEVDLMINAGLMVDMPHLEESGAKGIGLFRTEFQFMIASSFPRISDQRALYERVLDTAKGQPVTFRSLDIGGDKVLPYMRTVEEGNPAMGWRALRLGFDRPGLLRSQIRALLHAAAGRELRLMFPMVADVAEFTKARGFVDREIRHLCRHGHAIPKTIRLGTMLEVPSLLFQLDELMAKVDFVAIGSNDLFQFMMAVDRGNSNVADRFDEASLGFMRALKLVAEKGRDYHVPVTICGEIAGRPLMAIALVALGYRQLSMSPPLIGPVKAAIRALPSDRLRARLLSCLDQPEDSDALLRLLRQFAKEHDIPI